MATAEPNTPNAADAREPRFRPRGRIVRAEDVNAWENGLAFLKAARREAAGIRAEAALAREQEKVRGFEDGKKEGAEEIARLLAETCARADRFFTEADEQVVELAVAVVQRMFGDLDTRQLIGKAVQHALQQQRLDQHLTLYTSPDMVDELRETISASFDERQRHLITVEADVRLDFGACRLASPVGFVDLGPDAQLRALRRGLLDGLKHQAEQ
ncbi:MAG: type III secretion system stator protein SctL [Geminicoccaceae bacterium]